MGSASAWSTIRRAGRTATSLGMEDRSSMARPRKLSEEDSKGYALRPCLGPGCHHLIFTSKAVRLCKLGRQRAQEFDEVFGTEDRGPLDFGAGPYRRVTPSGLAAAMVET